MYRKSTFSGLGTHFFSCTPEFFKFNGIATLVNRAFSISSSWSLFHVEIDKLRNYFLCNKYPLHVFESIVGRTLGFKLSPLEQVATVPKLRQYIVKWGPFQM